MAYTSIIPVRCLDRAVDYVRDKTKTTRGPKSLQDAVDYAINREKTELDCFETGLSCVCETAFEDMRDTVQRWQQTAGVQGYHLVQSFAEGEVTPELAHQIGVELAEQLLQGRFQTVVTTHLNTKHYHNHIVWCSVALDNGRKYHSNAKSYYAGIGHFTFHALRHTFATRALERGMDYKTLSAILGHYSVSFTMDTYVHSMDEHKRNEMDKMDDLFGISLEISVEQQPYPVLFTVTEEGCKAFAPDFPKIQIQAGTMETALMEAKKQIQKALSQFKYPPIPTRQEDIVVPENSVLILLKTA